MTRMTGPDCVVMCNLINTYIHTYIINKYIHTYSLAICDDHTHYIHAYILCRPCLWVAVEHRGYGTLRPEAAWITYNNREVVSLFHVVILLIGTFNMPA